jgi:VWFA-related protein
MKNLTPYGCCLLLVSLLLQPVLTAQEAEEGERRDLFFESVDVNLVNVDVFVTDDKGNRVTDLLPSDFEVFEDGRPVEVTNFYVVEDRKYKRGMPAALPAPAVEIDASAPSGSVEASPPLLEDVDIVPDSQRLSVILFIDNLNIRPFDRNKVMREMNRFLHERVSRDDQVMVVSFERTTHVRQSFTNDIRLVMDALKGMEKDSALRVPAETERREVIRSIEMARDQSEALAHVELYAGSVYHDMRTSLDALKDLVGSLAGLPGRKALIHVSSGMPLVAADDLFLLIDQVWPNSGFSGKLIADRYSARGGYRELGAKASASRVTFYTLDASGLRSHNSLSAEYGGKGGNLGNRASLLEIDFARFSNETEPLQTMALDTGGLAAFNTNNFFGALEKIGEDFGTYSSLGYLSSSSTDGRLHTIDVKVKRKNLKVRHREGFRTRTPEAVLNDSTYASLLYDTTSNALGVEIESRMARPSDDGRFLLPIAVKIPIGNMALIPQENFHVGTFRVALAVIDQKGRLSPIDQKQIPVEIPTADLEVAREKFYVYTAELLMRQGGQTVAVGVRDDYSGESAFVKIPVNVGS